MAEAAEADAVVWTAPGDPEGLRRLLAASPARWVQLPFAGIESFVAAGAIDPARTFTCAKGAYGHSTGEHALALILACARRLDAHVPATSWRTEGALEPPERRVAGSTVLLVGTGGSGRARAAMLEPLRARILAVNRSGRPLAGAERTEPVTRLDDLLGEAHFVVLAAALTPATRHLFSAPAFSRMRDDAWLVNVARGALVDTEALVRALDDRAIAGAALDVTDPEPLADGHPLWDRPNAIITPHVANTWAMGLAELSLLVRRNVERFRTGAELEGLVDPELGY
ncbi:D-isomer specific 2-hydroxyacid dehydrogenase family protein [soil metagenome]